MGTLHSVYGCYLMQVMSVSDFSFCRPKYFHLHHGCFENNHVYMLLSFYKHFLTPLYLPDYIGKHSFSNIIINIGPISSILT